MSKLTAEILKTIERVDALQAHIDRKKQTALMAREDRDKIAWQLNIPPDELKTRVALNAATMPKSSGYVSLQISRETGALNALSESHQPIPSGIAAKPSTLTKDPVSDASTLREIARMLGIKPEEIAERLGKGE